MTQTELPLLMSTPHEQSLQRRMELGLVPSLWTGDFS